MGKLLEWMNPYMLWIKLGLIAALCLGTAWVSWKLAHADVEQEKQKAVAVAVKDMTAQYTQEKQWRQHYQSLADDRLAAILNKIADIKVEHKTITNNITKEIERDPAFYGQALPLGGREQWLKARALVDSALQEKSVQPDK